MQKFVDRLLQDFHFCAQLRPLRPRTIFIGGGTPTLLSPAQWDILLHQLQSLGWLEDVREFTVEANPETVTPELISSLQRGGVNRISLGAQSFNIHHLKTLERWHDPASVAHALEVIRQAGISNLNLDLIFAIPGQTLPDLDADLDRLLALQPTHLSCYGLTYEPQTALTHKLSLGQFKRVDEDLERAMYQLVMDRLAAAGFEHYEVSNWARLAPLPSEGSAPAPLPRGETWGRGDPPRVPSARCQHNLMYWDNANWLGLGPAAASHIDGLRWKNLPSLDRYLASTPEQTPVMDVERLEPARRVGERLMLGLRLREGISLAWLRENLPPADPRWRTIAELKQITMLQETNTHLRLTPGGLFVADAVIAKLL